MPAMWETWVQALHLEDTLEEEMATHSSILAWRIPWTEEPDSLQSMELQSQIWLTNAFTFHLVIIISNIFSCLCNQFNLSHSDFNNTLTQWDASNLLILPYYYCPFSLSQTKFLLEKEKCFIMKKWINLEDTVALKLHVFLIIGSEYLL